MTKVLAIFNCSHQYDVTLDEVKILQGFCYDPQCRRPREITAIVQREWMTHCYDCSYRRYFGKNGAAANDEAARHYRRHNSHRPGAKMAPRPAAAEAQLLVNKRLGVAS